MESRYILQPDGTKLPATLVDGNTLVKGSDRDLPFILGVTSLFKHTPAISAIGAAGSFYSFVHYGGEAGVPRGAGLLVIVSDDLIEGRCSIVPAVEGKANYGAGR